MTSTHKLASSKATLTVLQFTVVSPNRNESLFELLMDWLADWMTD